MKHLLILLISILLLSSPVIGQSSLDGYRDIKFGMDTYQVESILNRICKGDYSSGKRIEKSKGNDGALFILGNRCYSIMGEYRDIRVGFYSNTKKASVIWLELKFQINRTQKGINEFMNVYKKVQSSLKSKYNLDYEISQTLFDKWRSGEIYRVYEIYNQGEVSIVFNKQETYFAGTYVDAWVLEVEYIENAPWRLKETKKLFEKFQSDF